MRGAAHSETVVGTDYSKILGLEDKNANNNLDSGANSALHSARTYLEKNIIAFPVRKCQTTARFLNLAFGLEEIAGYYTNPTTNQKYPHTWNISEDGTQYIDLSLDQFNDYNTTHPSVSHLEFNTPFLTGVAHFMEKQSRILTSQLHPDLRYLVEDFIMQYMAGTDTIGWGEIKCTKDLS